MNISLRKIMGALVVASLFMACGANDSDDENNVDPSSSSTEEVSSSSKGTVSSSSTGTSSAVSSSSATSSSSAATSSAASSSSAGISSSSAGLACASAVLSGNITTDTRLCAATTYELSGYVYVQDGATLHVDAGTTIASAGKSALFILPGGKIDAVGTSSKPIVFKGKTDVRGSWAGVLLFGKAPVSTTTHTSVFEGGTETFGGTTDNDNSGVLKYVRIENAGYLIATDKELNALTMGGVGSGTSVSYVQIIEGEDDGIEWFGGKNDVDHLIVTGGADDGFDIDEGYQGKATNLLCIQGTDSDRCIEAGSKAADATQITRVDWSKVTLINNGKNQAIHIKDNVSLALTDAVILGQTTASAITPALVKVEGATSISEATTGETVWSNIVHNGSFTKLVDCADAGVVTNLTAALVAVSGTVLNDDLTPAATAAANAGAVATGDLWYQGWTTGVSLPASNK
jgi:hypothetical protein